MKMLHLPKICLLFLLFTSAVDSVSAQRIKPSSKWVGEYIFEISEPKTSGGYVPTVEYRLLVTEKKGTLNGQLIADGYQTDDRYICTVKTVGENKIEFYFIKDGTIPGEPVRNSHQKGSLLGSLSRINGSGKVKFLYTAGSYEIYPPAFAAKHPVYFKKIKRP